MYSVDGDFGKVRTVSFLTTQRARSVFNYVSSAGWHRCNDRYRIRREGGINTHLMFFTVSGCGEMTIVDRRYSLPQKTVAIIPAEVAHEYYVPECGEWEFYWMHFGGVSVDLMLDYLIAEYGYVIATDGLTDELCAFMEDLLFMKTMNRSSFDARLSHVVSQILHHLIIGLEEKRRAGVLESDAVKRLIQYLQTNYSSRISIEAVSRSLYLNSAYLTRRFKAQTGYTPYEYLTRYRIMMAKELLLYTEMSVKEIAVKTGFPYPSNFITQFKALESMTPGAFRRHTAGRS